MSVGWYLSYFLSLYLAYNWGQLHRGCSDGHWSYDAAKRCSTVNCGPTVQNNSTVAEINLQLYDLTLTPVSASLHHAWAALEQLTESQLMLLFFNQELVCTHRRETQWCKDLHMNYKKLGVFKILSWERKKEKEMINIQKLPFLSEAVLLPCVKRRALVWSGNRMWAGALVICHMPWNFWSSFA